MININNIIKYLIKNNLTISTMESCTGGFIASSITNIENSSKVFEFGSITYSNEFKIKMGVNENIINKYTVYSLEVSMEMAKKISSYANSDYGIGITGKMNKADENNLHGKDNEVFITIYDKNNDKYHSRKVKVKHSNRLKNKEYILFNVEEMFNLIML